MSESGLGEEPGEDPWAMLARPEVRPEQADAYARSRLGPAAGPDDPRRARAIVGWLLARAARDGHTAMRASTVLSVLAGYAVPDPAAGLAAAFDDGSVLGFEAEPAAGDDAEPQQLLALERYALAEDSAAESVLRLLATGAEPPTPADSAPADGAPADVALAAGVALLPHGPGEAGPSAVRALTRLAAERGLRPVVVSPRTFRQASGDCGLVVVGDAHLLDVEAAAAIGEGLPEGTRLVLAGDPAQLPPAGPGDVFRDLLAAGVVPVVKPPAGGAADDSADHPPGGPGVLAALAEAIRAGTLPPVNAPDREVVVVPATSGGEAVHRAVQLVTDSIPRALGIDAEQTQVLVPARRGRCGSIAVNAALKPRLNPGPGEFGGYDVGDRVRIVADHPEDGLGAGEVGVVAGKGAGGLVVRVGDRQGTLDPGSLEHGWAITVSQAQGSRWPAVVAVLPGEAAGLLSRPLVYTAVTRAGRHLSVVHAAGPALARAVAGIPERRRLTRLRGLLRELA